MIRGAAASRGRPLGFVRHAFISPPRDERTPKDVCREARGVADFPPQFQYIEAQ